MSWPQSIWRNRDLVPSYVWSAVAAFRERRAFADLQAYCMFLGYPRSGHSLVGALLNAHPDIVIAHELDALRYLQAGFRRRQLFCLILGRDRWFARRRWQWEGYDYSVRGQWQGGVRRLLVIGDKKGGRSAARLARAPWVIDRLRDTVNLPLRIIHHVRNPFDNIATIARRDGRSLQASTDYYFRLCETVENVRQRLTHQELHELRHEDLVADPRRALIALLEFLGVEADADYLNECGDVVFAGPRKSRELVDWEPEIVASAEERMRGFPFLKGYRFVDVEGRNDDGVGG